MCCLLFNVCNSLTFGMYISIYNENMTYCGADGVAFSGPGSDPATDGASLRHPGAQAGIIRGGGGGGNWWGRRGRWGGSLLLGLWERRWKRQRLHFFPQREAEALRECLIEEKVQQEELGALRTSSVATPGSCRTLEETDEVEPDLRHFPTT